jgi:hypothetical protein
MLPNANTQQLVKLFCTSFDTAVAATAATANATLYFNMSSNCLLQGLLQRVVWPQVV